MSIRKSSIALSALALALSATIVEAQRFTLEVGPPVAAAAAAQKKTKGALFAVRPRGCMDAPAAEITGTAEGLVNGVHRSVPLKLAEFADGVRVVASQWTEPGAWIVVLSATCGNPRGTAAAIVPVPVFGAFSRDGVQILDHTATPKEIDVALAAVAKVQPAAPPH